MKIVLKPSQKKICSQESDPPPHTIETPLRTEGLSFGYFAFINNLLHPVDEYQNSSRIGVLD